MSHPRRLPDTAATPGRVWVFGTMRVGPADADVAGAPVPRGACQRVLGYLSLHPGSHRREALTESLWPDAGDRARRALSDALYRLRRHLGDGWIAADGETVALAPGISVDVRDFDRLASSDDPADLQEAAALAHDDLLPAVYDDWAEEHRRRRHLALLGVLGRAARRREREGDLEGALLDVRRILASAPLDEAAHQLHLRLLGRLRRYGEAVAHYEELQRLLREEVGVAPLAETTEIVDRLRGEREVEAAGASLARPPDEAPFVGRRPERALLVDRVDGLLAGRGGVVCVEGVAGIGKSRLLDELVRSARWRGALVGSGTVRDVPESSPLAPLAAALEPLLTAPMVLAVEDDLDAASLRSLAPLHPGWAPADAVEGGRARPVGDGAARFRQALRMLGARLGAASPVLVVLDDVHWASPTLWDALDALAEGLVPSGGLLAAAYRRPEVESSPGWATIRSWDQQGLATVVGLEPLDLAEVDELVRTGPAAADGAVEPEAVLALTGGIPFYVAEWLGGTTVQRDADGGALVRRRLDDLDDDARHALHAAATIGTDVPFRAWAHVTARPPLALGAVADRLVAARWLVPTAAGHAFGHDLLRRAAYDDIAGGARQDLHRRAASAVVRLDPANARSRAYHLDRAGDVVAAVDAYREAGAASRAALAFDDAVAAFHRAFELLARDRRRQRLEVGLDLAETVDVVGGGEDQHAVLTEVVALARQLDDEPSLLRALLLLGGAAARLGDLDEGRRTLRRAVQLAERTGDQRALAEATYRDADLLAQSGRWEEARERFTTALALADPERDGWLHGRILRGVAIAAIRMGRPVEAVRRLDEAVAGYRAAGDRLNELVTCCNLAAAHYELGSWGEVEAASARAHTLSVELGDTVCAGIALQHLAFAAMAVGEREAAWRMVLDAEDAWARAQRRRLVGLGINTRGLIAEDDGRHAEAISLYTEALESARTVDAATEEAYAAHDLGALLVTQGRPDEAVGLLRGAVRHWVELGNTTLQAKSEAHLGLALLALGGRRRRDEAGALAEAGLAVFRAGPVQGEHPEAWLFALQSLLDGLDRRDDADEVLAAAGEELRRQAATIPDPERRRRFFDAVPLNRAITDTLAGRAGAASTVDVSLARVGAPLGRALRDDERVTVRWTLRAADDGLDADPAARRRHRLRRLLDEAAAAGAAPTDEDLASALGVSRRTVLRDMAVVGDAKTRTRRRARSASIAPVER